MKTTPVKRNATQLPKFGSIYEASLIENQRA
jgi:hypothetical protein